MPLWQIFHPEGTFEDAQSKQALSEDVTQIYVSRGLPYFYVTVVFIKTTGANVFVGGKPQTGGGKPFIRIAIDHIAIKLPNEAEEYEAASARIAKALKPHIADKNYDWEWHVTETERRLWQINGLAPPPWRSEEEKLWFNENRAIPY